jgi:hypothetical protein
MTFKDSMADNVKSLRIWHQEHHHANNWASCPHSPCNVTTPTFRANWDQS